MKQNNHSKLNFVTSFKFWIIIPAVIALTAIIMGIIFGLNLDYDFKKVNTFNVNFNTTVLTNEYDLLETELNNIITNHEVVDYQIEKVGFGAENGLIVRIVQNDKITDDFMTTLKTDIENNLHASVSNKIVSPVVITTTNTIVNMPINVLSVSLYATLAVGCILIFAFFYNWIRYNLVAGYSLVLSVLFEVAMLFAMQIVCRIPFNTNFIISYILMIATTIIITTIINNHIKNNLNEEKYAKFSNQERVFDAVKLNYLSVLVYIAIAILALIACGIFAEISVLYTIISICLGLIISIFTSLFFNTTLWSLWYKKDKDLRLKRRIELEKKRLEDKDKKNKTDDKIVV